MRPQAANPRRRIAFRSNKEARGSRVGTPIHWLLDPTHGLWTLRSDWQQTTQCRRSGHIVLPEGQPCYSDLAIETGLMLRLPFHLPWRQTEGLMASVFELLDVSLCVPDHSTLSRRAMNLVSVSKGCRLPLEPSIC